MVIAEPQSCGDFVAEAPSNCLRMLAHPTGTKSFQFDAAKRDARVAVGPEGGFTDEEVSHAVGCGWECVQLGSRILRVETAAVAIAAVVSWWERNK